MRQRTVKHSISCFGIGVHSGNPASITLHPSPPNSGIVFVRTDILSRNNQIVANYSAVSKTRLGTTIQNEDKVEVATIEHLMAALWGCGIDNVMIEIDGDEIPIMDGSSEPFIFMIECAGTVEQSAHRQYIKILKELVIKDGEAKTVVTPSDKFDVDIAIQFDNKAIASQHYSFSDHDNSFKYNIARARTFGFEHEGDLLKKLGLAKGASLDNAVVLRGEKILNAEGLRYEDEFVRHKLLDLIGDLYLAGHPFKCHIESFRPGHTINNKVLHTIFSDNSAWQLVSE